MTEQRDQTDDTALAKGGATREWVRAVMRWILGVFYIGGFWLHVRVPEKLLAITPDWVPFPRITILVTGVLELLGGLALLFIPKLRPAAGIGLALYALCVWPVNFKHAIEGIDLSPMPNSWWYHGPRLAFQPVLIWWALFCANVIDWPLRRRTRPED